MNELQIFKYEENEIRIVQRDGQPWWVLKDVCDVLGISKYRDTATRIDDDERGSVRVDTPGGEQDVLAVNEPGLYSVILRSDKPEAAKFKRWITHEVLPSIRKHGAYMTPAKIEEVLRDPDTIIRLATVLKEEQAKNNALATENAQQKQIIGELKPKADYVDYILSSTGTMATTQIAADYGMSAKRLNKILRDEKIQWFVNGQWVLYTVYMNQGLAKSETISITHSDGRPDTKLFTKWTQKGRLKINDLLNRRGIYANADIRQAA